MVPQVAAKFLAEVRNGSLTPQKLLAMSSEQRRAALEAVVGKDGAEAMNAAFEQKLLLKNVQSGIANWIQKSAGLTPEVQRDLLSRVERLDSRILEPQHLHDFLADLAKKKLGVGVTMQEAGQVATLARDVANAKASANWDAYMNARVAFREYVASLEPDKITTPFSKEALVAYVRAGALSWPTTIAKLTSVAISRVVTTPVTDAVALGVSKVLPRLAEGAPRYGTRSLSTATQAELAAQSALWTDGLIDSGRLLRNKASRLDLMHDDHAAAHAWYEYFGSLHGALKEPIKRAEYARSLFRRTAEADGRGEDVHDMTVRLRLSTEAFKDAQRAISMNDNAISSAWNAGLRRLEQRDPATGKTNPLGSFLATAARVDLPVMKAPTNIVLEASEYIGGLLSGGSRAAWEYAHGLEDLKPVERDMIIRQIAKGAVGAAIMTLYYFKHDKVEFGGFYEPGEKRAATDVPAGAARLAGVDIPKQLLHNPMIDAGQFAASVARVSSSKLRKKDQDPQGLASGIGAAAVGLIDEVPVIGSLPRDIRSLADPHMRSKFVSQKIASAAVPGIVQWIAKKEDDDRKRAPANFGQALKANLPILRQSVPLKPVRSTP